MVVHSDPGLALHAGCGGHPRRGRRCSGHRQEALHTPSQPSSPARPPSLSPAAGPWAQRSVAHRAHGRGIIVELGRSTAVELPWNGHSGAWNYRGTGPRGAWNCRGTAVEVTLRAAKLPGAERSAPDPLSLWRVVWKRGAHLSPFPRIVPAFSPRDVYASRPPMHSARPGLNHRTRDSQRGRPPRFLRWPCGPHHGPLQRRLDSLLALVPGRTAQPRPREHRGGRTGRLPGLAEPEGAAPDEHSAGAGCRPGGMAPGADSIQPAATGSRRRARQRPVRTWSMGAHTLLAPAQGESGGISRLDSAGERVGIRSSSATSPGALARRVVPRPESMRAWALAALCDVPAPRPGTVDGPWPDKGERPGGSL